jgi:AcrR family transcriptional regulator
MIAKRDGNTRDDILAAAIELYSQNGATGTSVRDITRKVGINESSLYNHFASKDHILDAIIEKFQREFGEVAYDESKMPGLLEGVDPEQFFTHHLMYFRSLVTPQITAMWKVVYMEMFRDKRARDFVRQEMIGRPLRYYEKAFSHFAAMGSIGTVDPALAAQVLEYGFFGASVERMLMQTDGEDVSQVAQRLFAHLKFVCQAIKSQ